MKNFLAILIFCIFASVSIAHSSTISEYKVGQYRVYMLPENQMVGNRSIFLNAPPEDINKFFRQKTFPMYLNAFLVQGPEQTVLIDSGFGNKLFEHLEKLNISPDDINTIFLTHMHRDHIGGLLRDDKATFTKATVWVAEEEKAYWTNKEIQKSLPKRRQQGFEFAQKFLEVYGDRVKTFKPLPLGEQKEQLASGIRDVTMFGHTPGHTGFFVGEGKDALLIWADLVHMEKVQMRMPHVAVIFDVDPKQAVATRQKMLSYIAKNKIKVAGMHIGREGVHTIKKHGDGYEFVEVEK